MRDTTTNQKPDFYLEYTASLQFFNTTFINLINRLREVPHKEFTFRFKAGYHYEGTTYTFQLAENGSIINFAAARFLAKYVGKVLGHDPRATISRDGTLFELFGGDQDVWLAFFDEASKKEIARGISYLLAQVPVKPNFPNSQFQFFSGVTKAPFPQLGSLEVEKIIDSLALAFSSHPMFGRNLENEAATRKNLDLFGAGQYVEEIVYLAKAIQHIDVIFKMKNSVDIRAAAFDLEDHLLSFAEEFSSVRGFLMKYTTQKYKDEYEAILQGPSETQYTCASGLFIVGSQLNDDLDHFFPQGLVDKGTVAQVRAGLGSMGGQGVV